MRYNTASQSGTMSGNSSCFFSSRFTKWLSGDLVWLPHSLWCATHRQIQSSNQVLWFVQWPWCLGLNQLRHGLLIPDPDIPIPALMLGFSSWPWVALKLDNYSRVILLNETALTFLSRNGQWIQLGPRPGGAVMNITMASSSCPVLFSLICLR